MTSRKKPTATAAKKRTVTKAKPAGEVKYINLALQGGGAHGAFTWGVLDRLLEEERIVIEGISGTSAGAMNGAVLASGYIKGGRQGARENLAEFWKRISDAGQMNPLQQSALERWLSGWNLNFSPGYNFLDLLSRIYSPYDFNPLNINPLRYVLEEFIDEEALRTHHDIRLFIAATHVASGQARIFHCEEISTDVLLASACIPFMFQAVEIEGESYWDGGYMGNPVIWPLIYNTRSEDVLLVQINPLHRDEVPKRAYEITNRLNEISFNSSLIAEMRAIEFVQRLIREKKLDRKRYKDLKIHLIYSAEKMHELDASSKLNTSWDFFRYLHQLGYEQTENWIQQNFGDLGKRSTVNIREKFLYRPTRGKIKTG